jgi:hypothetical protein
MFPFRALAFAVSWSARIRNLATASHTGSSSGGHRLGSIGGNSAFGSEIAQRAFRFVPPVTTHEWSANRKLNHYFRVGRDSDEATIAPTGQFVRF